MEEKIVLVCGSRTFRNRILMFDTILKFKIGWEDRYRMKLRHGKAKGADEMSEKIFITLGLDVEQDLEQKYKPKYKSKYDPNAPKERNTKMLEDIPIPFIVLAFYNKVRTSGTLDTVTKAKERGIDVMEFGLR